MKGRKGSCCSQSWGIQVAPWPLTLQTKATAGLQRLDLTTTTTAPPEAEFPLPNTCPPLCIVVLTQAQMFSTGLAFKNVIIKQLGLKGTSGSHPVHSTAQSRVSHKIRPAQNTVGICKQTRRKHQARMECLTRVLTLCTCAALRNFFLHHDAQELLQKHFFC